MNLQKLKKLDNVCQTSKLATTPKQVDSSMSKIAKAITSYKRDKISNGVFTINEFKYFNTKRTPTEMKLDTKSDAKESLNDDITSFRNSTIYSQSQIKNEIKKDTHKLNKINHSSRKFYRENENKDNGMIFKPLSSKSLHALSNLIHKKYIKPKMDKIQEKLNKNSHSFNKHSISNSDTYRNHSTKPLPHKSFGSNNKPNMKQQSLLRNLGGMTR